MAPGRPTDVMAAAWPDPAGDPFADEMNAIEKHVVSGTVAPDDIIWTTSRVVPADGALVAIAACGPATEETWR